jgi:hypothetical protein
MKRLLLVMGMVGCGGPLAEIRVKQSTSKSHYHPLRRSGTKHPVGFSIALPETLLGLD